MAWPILRVAWIALSIGAAAADTGPLDVVDDGAPAFTVYTERDGLSDEIWSAVDIDARGVVWAGSASGLARFDGYRWTPWPADGARSLVRDMERDAAGRLWAIFEREGLAQLDGDTWRLLPEPIGFLHSFSPGVGGAGPARLWIARERDAVEWVDGRWATVQTEQPGSAGLVRLVRTESLFGGPRLWFATMEGLWYRDLAEGASARLQRFPDPRFHAFASTDMLRLEDRGVEELWVLSYGAGIGRIRDDGVRVWRAEAGELPTEAIYNARTTWSRDGTRRIWMSSRAGLLQVSGDRIRVFDRRHGLPADAVRSIEVQRDVDGTDILWLATEGGIVRAPLGQHRWQTVSLLGARENGIFGLLLEPDGHGGERLWVGTSKEGLHLLEQGRWRQFSRSNGELPLDNVRRLARAIGPDGKPWRFASVIGALYRIDEMLHFERIGTPWDDADDGANAILSRQHEGAHEFWFGTLRSGLHRLRDGRWTHHLPEGAELPWAVTGLTEQIDTDGRSWLWAATGSGLARLDGDRWTLLPAAPGLPSDGYRYVTIMRDGDRQVLWAGSNRHGLVRLDVSDPRSPSPIVDRKLPPPPDPTVYSVLADSIGRLYVCTNNGVQQLTPDGSGGYSERVFRRRDGLVHDECNTNSQQIDARDRYWVGTLGGLSMFDPAIETPTQRTRPKPILLIEVRVAGERRIVAAGDRLALPAGTRGLAIGFALLSGQRETDSRYRTQLTGFDPEPTPWSAEHERTYSALPPGEYRFTVAARDYAGTESSAELLTLEVEPFWWQRRLVQASLALFGLLAIAAAVLLYNRNLRARQRKLKREVAARTAELDAANQRLTELSYQDPLTGVANRRRLMEALDAAIERARERQLPLGLIVTTSRNTTIATGISPAMRRCAPSPRRWRVRRGRRIWWRVMAARSSPA